MAPRRAIPDDERKKLWARAAGRCMICNRDLLEGAIAHTEEPLGEAAHIVGQQDSDRSPRGISPMSPAERDTADNLILMCADHHDEIDRPGAAGVLTTDVLRAMKQRREAWIRQVTAIAPDSATVVLRMVDDVRARSVELSRATAAEAVIRSSDRMPDFVLALDRQGIEIDLRDIPGEATADAEYWRTAVAKVDEVVDHRVRDGLQSDVIRHLSVFGLARLPLLVYLGSKLDDTVPVTVYQRHRDSETWIWPAATGSPIGFSVDWPPNADGDEAVLVLNVSGTLERGAFPAAIASLPAITVTANVTPAPDTIRRLEDLAAFEDTIRQVLSRLEQEGKKIKRLHTLAALPVSAAVVLGRVVDPHVHPDLVIYNRTDDGRYETALEIQ